MARRTFDVIDVVEVPGHWHAGRPKLVIAESLGLDVKTVRKYAAPAEAAGMVPGGPPPGRASWAELVRAWFPGLVDARARSLTHPVIATHRDLIAAMLGTNTVTTVHQRLRDEHRPGVSLTSFRRYVWTEFPDEAMRERVRVPRPLGCASAAAGSDNFGPARHAVTSTPSAPPANRPPAPSPMRAIITTLVRTSSMST